MKLNIPVSFENDGFATECRPQRFLVFSCAVELRHAGSTAIMRSDVPRGKLLIALNRRVAALCNFPSLASRGCLLRKAAKLEDRTTNQRPCDSGNLLGAVACREG